MDTSFAQDAPAQSTAIEDRPVVRWSEIAAVLLLVALCDFTIYRGAGFAGFAALLLTAPVLLVFAAARPRLRGVACLLIIMLVLLAARLLWLGSFLGVVAGLALLVALAIAVQGRRPHVLTVLAEGFQTIVTGYRGLLDYGAWAARIGPRSKKLQWLAIALPLAAVVVFGWLFVMANPDLVKEALRLVSSLLKSLDHWWMELPFYAREVVFWIVVAWFVIGLVRPRKEADKERKNSQVEELDSVVYENSLYVPFRNTLVSVIVLFAVYLVFEYRTLWFRKFPEGFYYAGYAHEGAAWLTTALAFATLALSLIFRGELLHDPRIGKLRTLAWIWSAENLLLALTVFHRMQIYVDFNGMTRMRTVALFGTATVVVGFVLVVWKIVRNYDFAWLVKHQLLTLALAAYLYALTPIDALVHQYNVRHALAGDLPPVVQIMHHPVDSEGIMMLVPLADCQDTIVRDGIRALLAHRALDLEAFVTKRESLGWTSYQAADAVCLSKLRSCKEKWGEYLDDHKRGKAINRLRDYSYQWY